MNIKKPDVIRQPLGVTVSILLVIMVSVIIRAIHAPSWAATSLSADMPLGRFIDSLFPAGIFSCIPATTISLISAALLNGIIVRYSVSAVRTYLPMTIFTLLAYGIYFPAGSVSATLTPLLLILACGEQIAGFKRSYQFERVFRGGFYIGMIAMISATGAALLAIVPVTLILYRRTAREAIAALAGILVPWLLCSVIWWGAGETLGYVSRQLWTGMTAPGSSPSLASAIRGADTGIKAFLALCAALCLYSVVIVISRLGSLRTRARKIYIHFLWLLPLCTWLLFAPGGNSVSAALFAVPACVMTTAFFIRYRGWLPLLLYILLVLSVTYLNILSVV